MTRKRRVAYPPPRRSKGPAPAPTPQVTPPTVAVINMRAAAGKPSISVGMRVTITGAGLYSGETAIVESLVGGVIPAAAVRTEAGRTRRVRTIDLVPAPPRPSAPADEGPTEP
jgi:hypothetical protein